EVIRIAAMPALRAKQMVAGLYAGSDGWRDYMSTYTLTSPEILYGVHIAPRIESIHWELDCNGEMRSVDLEPLPLKHSSAPVESWWDLAPGAPPTLPEGRSMTLPALPLYLRHPERSYWFEYLPNAPPLYFQYNRSTSDPQYSIAQFEKELLNAMSSYPKAALIVDLRFNTGGDGSVGRQIMEDLQAASASRRVYVIIGRTTFSAGLFHAVQWKHW